MGEPLLDSISGEHRESARLIWDYHQMHHRLRKCAAAIGVGGAGPDVPEYAAELYHAGWFPAMVFTGAASHRAAAISRGVPGEAIMVESRATNTALTLTLSRDMLLAAGIEPRTVMLVAEPAMQRRAYATCRKVWPEVTAVCASGPLTFEQYAASASASAADERHAIDELVGALQRVIEYPWRGYAERQDVPPAVHVAYRSLLNAGYTSRLLPPRT